MNSKVVIVGSGHAGGMLSIQLRKQGFQGEITIIGDEPFIPYARPELSKGFLTEKTNENGIYLKTKDYYKRNTITTLQNLSVTSINKKECLVETNNEESIQYDILVLATGSKVRKIKSSCSQEQLYYLRTINDSKKIKCLLNRKNIDIGIIGSGYIGLEVASIAAKKNHSIYLFDSEERVMKRSTCPEISEFIESKHKKNGVDLLLGNKIKDIEDHKNFKKIICNNNAVKVDEIIVGIGIEPNITLAVEAGLDCDNGIITDENCMTSETNILAIGDCTNAQNPLYDKYLRIESVHNALQQSKIATSYIMGIEKPEYEVPWFWSNQYDLKITFTGISNHYDEKLLRGSIEKESFSICYLKNNRLIAMDSINRMKDFIQSKKIMGRNFIKDKNKISDENINLKDLIA